MSLRLGPRLPYCSTPTERLRVCLGCPCFLFHYGVHFRACLRMLLGLFLGSAQYKPTCGIIIGDRSLFRSSDFTVLLWRSNRATRCRGTKASADEDRSSSSRDDSLIIVVFLYKLNYFKMRIPFSIVKLQRVRIQIYLINI